jgi:glycosyltransferase involved in cell wall biosynthesis
MSELGELARADSSAVQEREPLANPALCVLLPVYNAQESLAAAVDEIVEVAPDLSGRFELCLLDDGSIDDTAEIAYELAASYPQIKVIRHPARLGLAETIQTALDSTNWEMVAVGGELYALEPDDLRTLWQLRESERHAGREPDPHRALAMQHWTKRWSRMRSGHHRGLQLVRRATFDEFRRQQMLDRFCRIDPPGALTKSAKQTRPNFIDKIRRIPR